MLSQKIRITLLVIGFFLTILMEIFMSSFKKSSSPKITLFERMQSTLTLKIISFTGVFILLMELLKKAHGHGTFPMFIIFLKYFELLPLLIDFINLLFIYQYKMKHILNQNSFNRLDLSFLLTFIRLIIHLDVVHQKCDHRSKRQMIVIFDLLLFILVNISLLRDSNMNLFRIGRKIILGSLIFQLSDLFCSEAFWIASIKQQDYQKEHSNSIIFTQHGNSISNMMDLLHTIIHIRWVLSSLIICLYMLIIFHSIITNDNGSFVSINHIIMSLKAHGSMAVCMFILFIIYWDKMQIINTLNQKGVSSFCIGFDVVPSIKPTEMPIRSSTEATVTIRKDDRLGFLFFHPTFRK
jgi:hypothetical protein